tara:strand:+ start:1596 stop:2258 length:663 start_codon:yes stop_codon:yes gene_type:complete
MAYRTIANSEVSVDAPVDNALMVALRDNGEAINQAQSGAPKIQMVALDESINDGSANTLNNNFPTSSEKTDIGSDNLVTSIEFYNGELYAAGGTNNDLNSLDYTFRRAGTYNISIVAGSWDVSNVVIKLFRNGSQFYTSQTFDFSWDYIPDDTSAAFEVGDTLSVRAVGNAGTGSYYNAMVRVHSSNSFSETTGIGQINVHDTTGYSQYYKASALGIYEI